MRGEMMGRARGGGGRGMGRGAGRSSGPPPHQEKERRQSGWGVAPPSRHLWVGSLGTNTTAAALSELFVRFGDVESIDLPPGRGFAFVSLSREEDAVMAHRGLQGARVAGGGGPIRVEFSKGDRPALLKEHGEHSYDRHFVEHKGDFKKRATSPVSLNDKSKQRPAEPSEVLWIGFPSVVNVDEHTLRRAFSPFGEVVKITVFPGRTYAFVQFRTIAEAFRAKETLQGKLFNNPKVSICFARSEGDSTGGKKGLLETSYSPNFHSTIKHGFRDHDNEPFERDGDFSRRPRDFDMVSPLYRSHSARVPRDVTLQPRVESTSNFDFEHALLQRMGRDGRMSDEIIENSRFSPSLGRTTPLNDMSYAKRQRFSISEDPWVDEATAHPLYKKPKIDLLPGRELPEFPFHEIAQSRHDLSIAKLPPRFPGENPFDSVFSESSLDFSRRPLPDESHESWRLSETHHVGSVSGRLQYMNSGIHQPVPKEEWKWEGTIAKGGAPVCRARCFPVGKVLDFMLPEVLNCTARTSLEMLAKHYYQAAQTWVVFFVPETDSDITFYNDFMHYLGEKNRAAVAKFGEKMSLFLVPPSEFSVKVLKVPGNVSISGVILKFHDPDSSISPLENHLEGSGPQLHSVAHRFEDANIHADPRFDRLNSLDIPTGLHSRSSKYFGSSSQNYGMQDVGAPLPLTVDNQERLLDSYGKYRQEISQKRDSPSPPSWSNDIHSSNLRNMKLPPFAPNSGLQINEKADEYPFMKHKAAHVTPFGNISEGNPASGTLPNMAHLPREELHHPVPSSQRPLHSDQIAHLTALVAQQRNSVNDLSSVGGANSQVSSLQAGRYLPVQNSDDAISHSLLTGQQRKSVSAPQPSPAVASTSTYIPHEVNSVTNYSSAALPYASGPSTSYTSQMHPSQLAQQHSANVPTSQPITSSSQGNKLQASDSSPEETEADTQKRLQATLQLAAALLQQIQQQTKTGDQR